MVEMLSEKLSEGILDAVFSKGKEKAASFIEKEKNRRELKEAVEVYLDGFCEENLPDLLLDEEFDFEGFSCFVFSRQERLEEYFYGKNETRSAVLEVLRGEALAHAKPSGQRGRRQVLDCLDAVLAVIEHVLLKQVDTRDLFLATRTEEQILESVEKIVKDQTERIHSHIDYRGSFQELVDGLETELPDDGRAYHYRNSQIGFFGREKELKELDDFLNDDAWFLYTVITGPGGIGKSKLLYHYVRINRKDSSWKMLFPSGDIIEELCSYRGDFIYSKNLLVVVDYVGQYPDEIGSWMMRILGHGETLHKIRLALLERPSPEEGVKPEWYKKMVPQPRKRLKSCLWKKQFYEMKLMGREDLMALMDNIAGQEMTVLTDQNKQDIYERVCSFHHQGEGGSPLYTILTTDAFLNGIPLSSLDTNKLMEYVLERDEEYWETTICGGDQELYRCFKEMLVYATATGGWDFTLLGEPLTEESKCLQKIGGQGKTITWMRFSQLVKENAKGNLELKPLEPDLIGEYFVLDFLRDQMTDERYQKRIWLFWQKPEGYLYFLGHCVDSYLYQPEFEQLLDGEKTMFWYRKGNLSVVYMTEVYMGARLMVNLTAKQNAKARAESVDRLRKLSEEIYPYNEMFAKEYVKGLYNLSQIQDSAGRKKSVNCIGEVLLQYEGNELIARLYARGLTNLTANQDAMTIVESVEKQRALSQEEYVGNEEIALEYAKGLTNLTAIQNASGRAETIEQLRKLSEEQYTGNKEIAYIYAIGLHNLSLEQDLPGEEASVERLGALSEQYAGNEKIACLYARRLMDLTTKQKAPARAESVERLRKLSEETYVENENIALEYAKVIFSLSIVQALSDRKASVEYLRTLSAQYAENEEFACLYAVGEYFLGIEQGLPGRRESVDRLSALFVSHERNEAIAFVYAQGLMHLTEKQDAISGAESVERLEKLSQVSFAGNEAIALVYARGLMYLIQKQDAISGAASIEQLKKLSQVSYAGNEAVALVYAKGLTNLIGHQDVIAGTESVEQLGKLSQEEYAQNEEIALEYAKGLFNLSFVQEQTGHRVTVECMRRLSEQYAGNESIAWVYALGLSNQIGKWDAIAETESLEELRRLSQEYAGSAEILLAYAKGMAWRCIAEYTGKTVVQACRKLYNSWQADPETLRQAVSGEPDGDMKTLKWLLLEHSELIPPFMKWMNTYILC